MDPRLKGATGPLSVLRAAGAWPALLIAALAAGLFAHGAGTAGADRAEVWLVEFDGPLGPAMADLPVITYFAAGGASAASAGTYIAFASHIAAMAPATNIGSSTPVSIGGAPEVPRRPGPEVPRPGQAPPDDPEAAPEPAGEPSDGADAMTRKVVNDAVAYLQSLAELRGRNIEWAEQTVREGANIRSSEALEMDVIDLVADDLEGLLRQADGREVELEGGTVVLKIVGAAVHRVDTDWKHDLLELITDPSIAYGLLIFGVYGLILEFYNPTGCRCCR